MKDFYDLCIIRKGNIVIRQRFTDRNELARKYTELLEYIVEKSNVDLRIIIYNDEGNGGVGDLDILVELERIENRKKAKGENK